MIGNLKRRFKLYIDKRVEELKTYQKQNQQILLDYSQISKLFPESCFMPLTTWSISPSTILHVLNDITINQRRHIVEFGSGASTIYIARLIKTNGLDTKFYSVESNLDWLEKMKSDIARFELQDFVVFINAPLTIVPKEYAHKEQNLWYDTNILEHILEKKMKIDLVLVDGPNEGSTPYARFSALPFLLSRLSTNVSVFLDDTDRGQEKEIVIEWVNLLGVKGQSRERYTFFLLNNGFQTLPFEVAG